MIQKAIQIIIIFIFKIFELFRLLYKDPKAAYYLALLSALVLKQVCDAMHVHFDLIH